MGLRPQKSPSAPSRAGPGDPFPHLTPAERDVWHDLIVRGHWLDASDAYELEIAVRHIVRARRWAAMGEKKGQMQRDRDRRGGPLRVAPWEKQHRAECARAERSLERLGFTPQSRAGLYIAAPERPLSEFEKLMDDPSPDWRPSGPLS